jgi:hypothetical protein
MLLKAKDYFKKSGLPADEVIWYQLIMYGSVITFEREGARYEIVEHFENYQSRIIGFGMLN